MPFALLFAACQSASLTAQVETQVAATMAAASIRPGTADRAVSMTLTAAASSPTPTVTPTNAPNFAATATLTVAGAQSVCLGKKLPQAAPYERGGGPHPFLAFGQVFSKGVHNDFSYNYPLEEWLNQWTYHLFDAAFSNFRNPKYIPQTLEQLQLGVCLSYDRILVENCIYTNSQGSYKVRRMQDWLGVEIIEARTGTQVDNFELYGGRPDACPNTADLAYVQYDVKVGAPIDNDALYERLIQSIGQ